jgi:hypothetical protein
MRDDGPFSDPFTPGVTHAAPATFPRPSTPPGVPLPTVATFADSDPTRRMRRPVAPPVGGVFTASDFTVEPDRNPLDAPAERAASGVFTAVRGAR